MASLLDNEGWQSSLEGASVEAGIARLEALLPAGTVLSDDYARFLRRGLLVLGDLADHMQSGTLDEPRLVDDLLAVLEACHAR